ncbi:DUF1642 domain-containing protein [Enterococcus faecalis]|uniref:DUF1642 domain-containing protein n=1 Tax=Enterococcus faecalis TaxID=1351 RepID=UPI001D17856C|nr:DUF1642 domain-containing protein [Enterococcus faecalis]MCC4082929.1 DUF1642 domain-containing protein [Enterococcus faecalis]
MNKQELKNKQWALRLIDKKIEKYTKYSDDKTRAEEHRAYWQGFVTSCNDMQDIIKELDEPKKVVVPPIIDKFIRENEDPIYEICAWADHYGSDGRTCEDSELSAVINWYGKNSNDFYQAVINGYEVKEEPLYYVELPEIGYLNNADGGIKHTEQEIKAIDVRYWPFAVKVDGE